MLEAYPSLTAYEFQTACKSLEKRCHDRLGGTNWQSVRWDGQELQITQRRPWTDDSGKQARGNLDSAGGSGEADDILDDSESDESELLRFWPPITKCIEVAFSITLSPTYAVPVLWFGARDIRSLDDLYRILVPQHLRGAVADVSVLGGITQAYHPVTGMPSYFVHPCNTHQALQALNSGQLLTPEAYLILWRARNGHRQELRSLNEQLTDPQRLLIEQDVDLRLSSWALRL